jgi:hypothetical protein
MGAPKGTDNFLAYRDTKVASNLRLIEDALSVLKKRKLSFDGLQLLAHEVAERAAIHRTTLLRNPVYKRLLLNYLASQPGASAKVRDEDATPELLKAKLFDARLEAKTLRSRISSLELMLSTKLPQLDNEQASPPVTKDWYLAFINTVMLLKLVLERINGEYEIVQVNFETEEVLDLAAPIGRQLIVGGARAQPFIQAYRTLLEQEGKLTRRTK